MENNHAAGFFQEKEIESGEREEKWKDDEEAEYVQYLATLSTLSLERLCKEPTLLSQKAQNIKQQMQSLAFNNYKAFILTSHCVQDIHKGVNLFSFLGL